MKYISLYILYNIYIYISYIYTIIHTYNIYIYNYAYIYAKICQDTINAGSQPWKLLCLVFKDFHLSSTAYLTGVMETRFNG